MATPTLQKTWQTSFNLANTPAGVLGTDLGAMTVLMKNAMKGFGLNPWTVAGSSNSAAAGMDGVDRLVAAANVVKSSGAHSWIVLTQPATGVQVCFDFPSNLNNNSQIDIIWASAGGFTGGSTTARPTASGERAFATLGWGGNFGSGTQYRMHVWHSSDGKCTRIMMCAAGFPTMLLMFDTAAVTISSGWTNPVICGISVLGFSSSDTGPLGTSSWINGGEKFAGIAPAGQMDMMPTIECASISNQQTPVHQALGAANELSSEYPILPVGLFHKTNVGRRGRHGYVFDWWFTIANLLHGDTFPNDGSHQFTVMGDMVFWTGGTVLLLG